MTARLPYLYGICKRKMTETYGWHMTNASRIFPAMAKNAKIPQSLLKSRIEARLKALGLSANEVGERAGFNRDFIGSLLRGGKRTMSADALSKVAKILECDEKYLLGLQLQPIRSVVGEVISIPEIGIAEAGAFRQVSEFEDDDPPPILAPRNQRYPSARHFALEVRGDSMNACRPTPILPGMRVLCVDMIDAELSLEGGKIYAVRRTLDGGSTFEWTLKRAHIFRDRVELHPESTNPAHKPIVVAADFDLTNTSEVAAVGLVYAVYSSLD